jgi:galactoside O-acetyltransferase
VIVGAGSVVLPGVTLAEGTAVGAMSLVTRSTEPWSVYHGVPARRQRARHRDMLELEKRYLAEEG